MKICLAVIHVLARTLGVVADLIPTELTIRRLIYSLVAGLSEKTRLVDLKGRWTNSKRISGAAIFQGLKMRRTYVVGKVANTGNATMQPFRTCGATVRGVTSERPTLGSRGTDLFIFITGLRIFFTVLHFPLRAEHRAQGANHIQARQL